jgi:hypothetical protein
MSTAVKRRRSEKGELEARGLTLEELEKRLKLANEMLKAIRVEVDSSKIDAILKSADYETYMSIDMHELSELEHYLRYELPDEIRWSIVKVVLGEHYIDPASVDYDKVGFADWESDECAHYAFVKLSDGRYAIVYSCGDVIEYALPEQ